MRKNNINNGNIGANVSSGNVNNIMNMLNMMQGMGGQKVASNGGDSVGGDKSQSRDTQDSDKVDSNNTTYMDAPLSRNAIRFANMIKSHDEAVKRIKENKQNNK